MRVFGAYSVVFAAAGCNQPTLTQYRTEPRLERGYALILPGIEGPSRLNRSIATGLAEGGFAGAIEIWDWGTGTPVLGWYQNLTNLSRNRYQARQLARHIVQYKRDHPARQVYLIGHSGGAGVLLLTLEALPQEKKVARAILLAAAVWPEYDLTLALRGVEDRLYNFYSMWDVGFLQVGTRLFGTIDRHFGPSAGAVGFRQPNDLSPAGRALYRSHLIQQPWTRQMARSGHYGLHTSWASKGFARDWLAPLLIDNVAAPATTQPSPKQPARVPRPL
jgi:pimeloyl-ACP methyl ester carboxylesterase